MSSTEEAPSTSYDSSQAANDARPKKPRGGKRGAGKPRDPDAMTQEHFDSLSDEQQRTLLMLATHAVLKDKYTKVGDHKVSLWDVGVALEMAKLSEETGLGKSTVENPREEIENKPGWMLRPGAPKMNLRPEEEDQLELELLGRGHKANASIFQNIPVLKDMHVLLPKRDFAYGVFCRPEAIRQHLAGYAKQDPMSILTREAFYQDVILHAPTLELTTMVVATKDLPIQSLATEFKDKVGECIDNLHFEGVNEKNERVFVRCPITAHDRSEVNRMAQLFTPESLSCYPITTSDGQKVLQDTTFFFSANPKGGVAVEVQTPGTLREQMPFLLGEFHSPALTYAVFDTFIGRNAIDRVAKADIGACVLFFANGFKMEPDPNNSHQWAPGDELKGATLVTGKANADLFSLPWLGQAKGSTLLVKNVRERKARREVARGREAEARGSKPLVQ